MTKDLNKGIQGILYNSLNLPQEMVISHVSARAKNYYTYTANGTKIRVVHKSDPALNGDPQLGSTSTDASLTTSITTDYIGNKIYQDGVLKTILTDNEYIEGGIYYFYIKDHLGNNRIVANSSGNVIQSTQYYPFGMAFGESTTTEQGKQDFKYNGKELDREHELNQYDYAARYYDPGYGRFTTIDPLAEKFYNWSPYVYCYNNPLKFIDPDGKSAWKADLYGNLYAEKGDNVHTLAKVQGISFNEASQQLKDQGYSISQSGKTNLKVGDIVYSEKIAEKIENNESQIKIDNLNLEIKFLDSEKADLDKKAESIKIEQDAAGREAKQLAPGDGKGGTGAAYLLREFIDIQPAKNENKKLIEQNRYEYNKASVTKNKLEKDIKK